MSLRSLIKKYRRLREVKFCLLSLPIELKSGTWHIDDGLFWQSSKDKNKVEKIFFGIYRFKKLAAWSWRTQVASWVLRVLAISPFNLKNNSVKGPSVIFKSRGGALKLFDFDNHEVISLISIETANNLNEAKMLPIFEFFTLNPFFIEQSLRPQRNFCIMREKLVDAPCMGMGSLPMQIQTMKKICSKYTEYAQKYSENPAPNLFEDCLDEVADCLSHDARDRCLMMKDNYLKFVRLTRTLSAHLDFNVANFTDNGDLFLFDIEDAGLRLPVTYDMNNLLLNEVYQDRPRNLLMEVLKDEYGSGFSDLLYVATGMKANNQLRISLFVNYILGESRYVSDRLLKHWDPDHVQRNWDKLARYVPSWPLIEHSSSS